MDPAAEELAYEPSLDVKDLISLEDVMETKMLGPNGGLVFCMEYLVTEGKRWLVQQLGDYAEDFIIVDMPGQVEVLSSHPAVPAFVNLLQREGYFCTVLYLQDALSTTADGGKFISGCLFSLSSMVYFDCPFINILTKCDLLSEEFKNEALEHFCMCDFEHMDISRLPPRWRRMTSQIGSIVQDYNLVTFRPMDVTNETYLENLCNTIDDTLQVADEAEVEEHEFENL
ncbi:GPN-loop GTPase 3 [Angomonas deanei]|nr:GPN-loop GTPase 3 [Angomonas deanei]EPY41366.1 GPN-loop GTPase 3 [Angomonas deanei]|eukprot:EPY29117.1 GPN-loop GTPase 3 [Angomonas deanei]